MNFPLKKPGGLRDPSDQPITPLMAISHILLEHFTEPISTGDDLTSLCKAARELHRQKTLLVANRDSTFYSKKVNNPLDANALKLLGIDLRKLLLKILNIVLFMRLIPLLRKLSLKGTIQGWNYDLSNYSKDYKSYAEAIKRHFNGSHN